MISIFIYSYGGYLFSFVFLAFVCSMVFALHRQGKEVDSSPKILLKFNAWYSLTCTHSEIWDE